MNAASANVEMWLELANALLVLAAMVFVLGGALGVIVTILVQRRAASRRQRGWLKALREADEERETLLGMRVVGSPFLKGNEVIAATDEQLREAAQKVLRGRASR